jgi:hypothetical protein
MKNELLIAQRKGPPKPHTIARLEALLERLGLDTLKERFFTPTLTDTKQKTPQETTA